MQIENAWAKPLEEECNFLPCEMQLEFWEKKFVLSILEIAWALFKYIFETKRASVENECDRSW